MELAEFLLARIAEDEVAAREAKAGPWKDTGGVLAGVVADHYATVAECNSTHWGMGDGEYTYPASREEGANAAHIARWDPTRVLAECEAKRRIVRLHWERGAQCQEDWEPHPCDTLRLLALTFADHPDYQQDWPR